MTETQDIRRLPDGSIDIAHYTRKGRALHGAAVRQSFCDIHDALLWLFALPVMAVRRIRSQVRVSFAVAAE